MTLNGSCRRARRLGRGRAIPAIVVPAVIAACAQAMPAAAQEPLLVRIHARPEAGAEAALAAREALWARRQAQARAVLSSVCAGCLRPWEPDTTAPRAAQPAAARAGLELDPVPGASGPPPEPANPQERP